MAKLMKVKSYLEEGEVWCKWLDNRFKANKNVLGVCSGATGSGKSYQDLRRAELWYQYRFKEPFPPENICFSIGHLMRRLRDGVLRKGELLIFEEAGASFGSLDFHNKVQKVFGYVLQSFRSLNIGVLFNLPYLTMMNKTGRTLIHYHFQTTTINPTTKVSKCKPFFRQVNQSTGKVYEKYLRVRVNGKPRKITRLNWSLPSESLRNSYEKKKKKFLIGLTEEFVMDLDEKEKEKDKRMGRQELTDKQMDTYELACQGYNQIEIGKMLGVSNKTICDRLKAIKKKGFRIEIEENAKRIREMTSKPLLIPQST